MWYRVKTHFFCELQFYVITGPGINDNGSGSATNLQLAILIARLNMTLNNRFRFAWWGAEELGISHLENFPFSWVFV
jgi:Zn-dependent M28 family amino/carboxypeptidase